MKPFASVLLLLLASTAVHAGDWPQFRGPNASGVSDETGLPVKWSKTSNVRWKAEIPGRGVSSPVVAAGRVYVTSCSGVRHDRLHVLCFDAATGKQLWHRQLWATGNTGSHPKTSMAGPTPVADADGVYALFATGDVAAFDRDGNLRWYRSLTGDYPTIANQVGMAASPILWKDVLIVPMDNTGDSFLAGLDTKTGRNQWKAPRPRDINWTTPVLRKAADGEEVLFQAGGSLNAYDPSSGERKWSLSAADIQKGLEKPDAPKAKGRFGLSSIPSPIVTPNRVFAPGGGLVALKPPEGKDAPAPLWRAPKLGGGNATPLVYRGRVYNVSNVGVLICGKADTGEVLWEERIKKGPYWASPVAADGKIYVFNEAGTATVVEAGDQPDVLASNDLGEEILATPAVADGAIFIRTDAHLYCIGKKK